MVETNTNSKDHIPVDYYIKPCLIHLLLQIQENYTSQSSATQMHYLR